MAKLVTGQMEPDDVGGGQVVDGELVETNDGGGAQSIVVGDARCTEAFMLVEARYQDEESDEWTTDIDYVQGQHYRRHRQLVSVRIPTPTERFN